MNKKRLKERVCFFVTLQKVRINEGREPSRLFTERIGELKKETGAVF